MDITITVNTRQPFREAVLQLRGQVSQQMSDAEALEDNARAYIAFWQAGIELVTGQLVRDSKHIYRVAQSHTTQADWQPANVPALFSRLES